MVPHVDCCCGYACPKVSSSSQVQPVTYVCEALLVNLELLFQAGETTVLL